MRNDSWKTRTKKTRTRTTSQWLCLELILLLMRQIVIMAGNDQGGQRGCHRLSYLSESGFLDEVGEVLGRGGGPIPWEECFREERIDGEQR